jgi:curved DNA-binding protein CbpA
MNYYEILGLRPDASADDIEQAYRTLARAVHPDLHNADRPRAEERMKQLNEIRDTLTDPLLRAAYDARMGGARPPSPGGPGVAAGASSAAMFRMTDTSLPRWSRGLAKLTGALAIVSLFVVAGHLVGGRIRDAVGDRARPTPPVAGEPTPPAPHPGPPRPRRAPRTVHIGSTAAEVLRALGPPQRTLPGPRSGSAVLVYHQLQIELYNGAVVGGDVTGP